LKKSYSFTMIVRDDPGGGGGEVPVGAIESVVIARFFSRSPSVRSHSFAHLFRSARRRDASKIAT
jgi:hypothetical protein